MIELPSFFATGLAKALTGEQPCLAEPWLKSRKLMEKKPQNPALEEWKRKHTMLLRAEEERAIAEGWKVRVEQFFRVVGETAILTGKPDLICQADGRRPKIIDTKAGEPHDYYVTQVGIYAIAIPLAWERPTWIFDGEVVYADGERVKVTPDQVERLRPELFKLIRQLAGPRPRASPSESACRFCDATTEICPDRMMYELPVVQTQEF